MDCLDLLTGQETLKCLQQHSSKASILQPSAFFVVQISQPYMTTGKTVALTIWTFVGKVMSLLFNMLSRFVIAFLPRSKCLLISWLQSPSAVILEPQKDKVCHCFHCFPIYLPWSDGTGHCNPLQWKHLNFPSQDEVKVHRWLFLWFPKVSRLRYCLTNALKRHGHKTLEL